MAEKRFVYLDVLYRGREGELALSPSGISFVTTDGSNDDEEGDYDACITKPLFKVPWEKVKKHRLNSPKAAEPSLRLTVLRDYGEGEEEETNVFGLSSRKELEILGLAIDVHQREFKENMKPKKVPPQPQPDAITMAGTESTVAESEFVSSVGLLPSEVSSLASPDGDFVVEAQPPPPQMGGDSDLVRLVYEHLRATSEQTNMILQAIYNREREQDNPSAKEALPTVQEGSVMTAQRLEHPMCRLEPSASASNISQLSSLSGVDTFASLPSVQEPIIFAGSPNNHQDINAVSVADSDYTHQLDEDREIEYLCAKEKNDELSALETVREESVVTPQPLQDAVCQWEHSSSEVSQQSGGSKADTGEVGSLPSVREPMLLAGSPGRRHSLEPNRTFAPIRRLGSEDAGEVRTLARQLDEEDRQAKEQNRRQDPSGNIGEAGELATRESKMKPGLTHRRQSTKRGIAKQLDEEDRQANRKQDPTSGNIVDESDVGESEPPHRRQSTNRTFAGRFDEDYHQGEEQSRTPAPRNNAVTTEPSRGSKPSPPARQPQLEESQEQLKQQVLQLLKQPSVPNFSDEERDGRSNVRPGAYHLRADQVPRYELADIPETEEQTVAFEGISHDQLIEAYLVAQHQQDSAHRVSSPPESESGSHYEDDESNKTKPRFWELSEVEFLNALETVMINKCTEAVPLDQDIADLKADVDFLRAAVSRSMTVPENPAQHCGGKSLSAPENSAHICSEHLSQCSQTSPPPSTVAQGSSVHGSAVPTFQGDHTYQAPNTAVVPQEDPACCVIL
ncbi:expressed unknown protein [Seminavis robusta]|uniref:Uncharacterized protein n=1 Tax=Seminavis robusta TaxID=568900 RepID=A0A9N8DIK6_9STRA|nr:expressed unknown protein [Seminavis robusta]|eukprot:Sro172_g075990.1 n/a (792) ;mRNA; r:44416-46791